MRLIVSALCVFFLAATQLFGEEVKVTVSKTHLCCMACLNAVDKTLGGVEGVKHQADQKEKTITVTATDVKSAKAALEALAKAGFYGELAASADAKELKFAPSEAPKGKVTRLEVSGVHNCCGACTRTIKEAVRKVAGVTNENVKARETSFVVEGDFNAAEVAESLLKAGFYAKFK